MKSWHFALLSACLSVIASGASFLAGNPTTGSIIAAAALLQACAALYLRRQLRPLSSGGSER